MHFNGVFLLLLLLYLAFLLIQSGIQEILYFPHTQKNEPRKLRQEMHNCLASQAADVSSQAVQ